MIKLYDVSKRYMMLFTHNSRYLPLADLLTDLIYLPYLRKKSIVNNFLIFRDISLNVSGQKNLQHQLYGAVSSGVKILFL